MRIGERAAGAEVPRRGSERYGEGRARRGEGHGSHGGAGTWHAPLGFAALFRVERREDPVKSTVKNTVKNIVKTGVRRRDSHASYRFTPFMVGETAVGGRWSTAGRWLMVDGRWSMATTNCSRWRTVDGCWSMVDGRSSNGVGCQSSAPLHASSRLSSRFSSRSSSRCSSRCCSRCFPPFYSRLRNRSHSRAACSGFGSRWPVHVIHSESRDRGMSWSAWRFTASERSR